MGIRIIAKDISLNAFHKFGIVGYITGIMTAVLLTYQLGLSLWVIAIVSLVAAFGFFFLNMVIKIGLKRENIVYYHHEIFILFLCGVVLFLLKLPVWRYLDVIIIAIGIFLFWGRMGCFAVGCCHGRLSAFGCIYKKTAHSQSIAPAYIGFKIFPIQILESIFVIILVSFLIFVSPNSKPGFVVILYSLFYGWYRFIVEFYRGDIDRPYWSGISEAQMTSLILVTISCLLSASYSNIVFSLSIIPTVFIWSIAVFILLKYRNHESILSAKSVYQFFNNARNFLEFNNRNIQRRPEVTRINKHTQLSISEGDGSKIVTLTQDRDWFSFETKGILKILYYLNPDMERVQMIRKKNTVHIIFKTGQ